MFCKIFVKIIAVVLDVVEFETLFSGNHLTFMTCFFANISSNEQFLCILIKCENQLYEYT